MYFMPASFATFTHSSALNFTGLKRGASFSYSFTGTVDRNMTHSPRPGERLPSPCPDRTAQCGRHPQTSRCSARWRPPGDMDAACAHGSDMLEERQIPVYTAPCCRPNAQKFSRTDN